ncbi:hypothetical protein ACFV9E_18425 [Streptomyces sp. NPDC059835]|uniref:hypothetical protein n=1 Tax=Streptomyces sp. NPDC059835 TaxID=3346967 RepID=UPI003656AD5D
MPRFLLGLALGALSGGVTYRLTADPAVAGLFAAIATVLTWLGFLTVIFGGGSDD